MQLSPTSNDRNDDRKTLRTEGRGGQPLSLVIERDEAHWRTCGSTEELERERQHEETIEKLNERQRSALVIVEAQGEQALTTTAKEVAARLELDGNDPTRKALDALQQLRAKGLVQGRRTNATRGKGSFWEFWPTTVNPDQPISRDRNQVTVATVATVAPPLREDPGDIHSSFVISGELNTTVTTGTTVGDSASLEKPDSKVTVVNSSDDGPSVRSFLPDAPGFLADFQESDLVSLPERETPSLDDLL